MNDHPLILSLDSAGEPLRWLHWNDAVTYQAKDLVVWSLGEITFSFNGGNSSITGERSVITTASIIMIKGHSKAKRRAAPRLLNKTLFRRDRHVCAYCAKTFVFDELTRDHVHPVSLGGKDIWTNVVTACRRCNHSKAAMTLEEAGMELIYAPYAPNRSENLILQNRNILADQMAFLLNTVPEHSRAHGDMVVRRRIPHGK